MTAPVPPPALPLEGRSVLVCDDDPEVCEMLVEFLEHLGARVEAVQDGRSALDQLRSAAFDALITDMRMPRMDGMGLIPAARQFDPGIVVIVMTGYASFDSALAVVRMGAHEYLKKPFDLAEVQRALSSGLSSREPRPVPPELAPSLRLTYTPAPAETGAGAAETAARLARLAALAWDRSARDLNAAGLAEHAERALRAGGPGARATLDTAALRIEPPAPGAEGWTFARPPDPDA